jgi:nitrogen regulatory protein PII 2
MVEIIAVVRPNKVAETKKALSDIGTPGFTCVRVSGRGKQAVQRTFVDGSVITTGLNNKRLFIVEAEDEDEEKIVTKLMEVNCTGNHGDGKIFIVNLEKSYSVRQGLL